MDPSALGDMGLEPQARARSNTWPLPRPGDFIEPDSVEMAEQKCGVVAALPGASQQIKKNSSRRNAWGNLSYADLITQAIGSAPDKRLTLSQIYEWMVQNVTYFKDKGDSNSSAGWKVRYLPYQRYRNTRLYTYPLLSLCANRFDKRHLCFLYNTVR